MIDWTYIGNVGISVVLHILIITMIILGVKASVKKHKKINEKR